MLKKLFQRKLKNEMDYIHTMPLLGKLGYVGLALFAVLVQLITALRIELNFISGGLLVALVVISTAIVLATSIYSFWKIVICKKTH